MFWILFCSVGFNWRKIKCILQSVESLWMGIFLFSTLCAFCFIRFHLYVLYPVLFAFYLVICWNDCLAVALPSASSFWYNSLIVELTMLISTYIVTHDSWLFDVLLVRTRLQRKRWAVLIQIRWLRLSKRHQSNSIEGGT